ncbi:MAG: hypothetical protein GZ088_03245 [Acidipila sp.]|nr:hypothetical protein [Acidipila sp.]
MSSGDVQAMFEFRHLISRLIPFWLWRALVAAGVHLQALTLLEITDFLSAVAAVMLMYRLLRQLEISRGVAAGFTAAFGISWAFWMYVGTGRPYSTSMFFALAAYSVAVSMDAAPTESSRLLRTAGAAALGMLSCLFWLQQFTSCIGVGMLVAMRPRSISLPRRTLYLAVYGFTGIVLSLAILLAGFSYTGVVHSTSDVQGWIAGTHTAPVKFEGSSVMKAAFGHAALVFPLHNLPYMVHGLLLHDSRLVAVGSLGWELSKFTIAWLIFLPVYAYALLAFRNATPDRKALLACFFVPLAVNLVFALLWLGSDQQRFLPSLTNVVVLAAMGFTAALERFRDARPARQRLTIGAITLLLFVAGTNLIDGVLRDQREFTHLAHAMEQARGAASDKDLIVFVGRDISPTYKTMVAYYIGPSYIDLGDEAFYHWARSDWAGQLSSQIEPVWSHGGRVFILERLALGENPVSAAWSEKQRPFPKMKDVALFLRTHFCVVPAWHIGADSYWQVAPRTAACKSPLDTASNSSSR